MCRWGCESLNTTFMCKWCGTWFCRECLRGAYEGLARESLTCRVCNQKKCQGTKVDFLIRQPPTEDDSGGKGSKSGSARGRSASPSKSAKSSKGGKSSGKKSGGKKGGKKSGKKKKKK